MSTAEQSPRTPEEQQLRVLEVLHYALGGITAAFFPFGLYFLYEGWGLMHPPPEERIAYRPGQELLDPVLWGAALVTLGVLWVTLCLMHGGLLAYVGRCIARRRRRLFSVVFSIFDLTYAPLGSALGIYALVVLSRPKVKAMFH
jgi:hypothetical protein